jgi:hypothetical protein
VIVIDEYLAVRVLGGNWPSGLPDDEDLGLPAGCHWRLLQRVHNSGPGRLSQLLASLPGDDLAVVRFPHPEVLSVIDSRPLLDHAARLAARYGGGLLTCETLAAGIANGRQLYFGSASNIGRATQRAASELGVELHVLT